MRKVEGLSEQQRPAAPKEVREGGTEQQGVSIDSGLAISCP